MGKILDSIFGAGNYGSVGPTSGSLQQAVQDANKTEWTADDEKQFQQLLELSRTKTVEKKLEMFSKLPTEVREEILRKLRKAIVEKAIKDITQHEHYDGQLQQLDEKHQKAKGHNHYSYYNRYRDYGDPQEYMVDKMPDYDELLRVHADHAVGEVLLGDKRK